MRSSFILFCTALLLVIAPPLQAQGEISLTATTNDIANLRGGPELTYPIVETLDLGVTVQVNGRRADNLWLRVGYNGQTGWIFVSLLNVQGDINTLPIVEAAPSGNTPSMTSSSTATGTDTTNNVANFRLGPSTAYSTIATLPANAPLSVIGRNADGSWLQVTVDGQSGWIFAALINTAAVIADLPVQAAPALMADTVALPTASGGTSAAGIVSGIGWRSRQIFRTGQTVGNRADVFSKVGDSISANPYFLYPIGAGGLVIDAYASLQPTVDYFSQTPANNHNSFANESMAVRPGWASGDILTAGNGAAGVCLPNETPLVCEYRVSRPAVALIMVGTNDILRGVDNATYRANLQTIITTSINMGVIPVISTLPDNMNGQGQRVLELNAIIRSLAVSNGVPLWDYWASLQSLPSSGIGGDGYHPSFDPTTGQTGVFTPQYMQYGYNMRNYTALVVLDALWRQVLGR